MKSPSRAETFGLPAGILLITLAAFAWFRPDPTPPWRITELTETTAPTRNNVGPEQKTKPPFTFITYNVKNWLVSRQSPEKAARSKAAVIRILSEARPDIIGLSEIGSMDDVKEIQERLKKEGFDLPHAHYTGGMDPVRHLAIISRFPIVSTESPALRIPDKDYVIQRGILDATIMIGESEVRFIGLHLKSKRNVPEFDQLTARGDEAGHVRRHLDAILLANPEALVIAYGDFNDTTRSDSTREILGTYRTPLYMNPIHVKDSRGESWTHSWTDQDIYTRIDFVTVSKAMLRHVNKKESRVLDDPEWEIASDHRPVLVRFK